MIEAEIMEQMETAPQPLRKILKEALNTLLERKIKTERLERELEQKKIELITRSV